jgi:hypothetical protein
MINEKKSETRNSKQIAMIKYTSFKTTDFDFEFSLLFGFSV